MKTERYTWGTAYYSNDGARCATVDRDPAGTHVARMFNVSHEGVLFELVDTKPADELGAHAVAIAWATSGEPKP